MIRDADDLLGDLRLSAAAGAAALPLDITLAERVALDAVTDAVLPERVASALGITVPEVIPVLMSLEMRGLLRCVGGRYERRLRAAHTA